MDAIEQANSGHPGLPLGCADIMATLYATHLRFDPKTPNWPGRDRFILSAGHGSMVLYSTLHLAGYDLPLDQIKQFRQEHSATPGHPEVGETPGVEATTGPLGQGIAMAVGIAIGDKHASERMKLPDTLETPTYYVLAGDGCLMEGVSAEASSFAGHLQLDNLVVIYDKNEICLDGPTDECFTENVAGRYKSYGWEVMQVDGHDVTALDDTLTKAKAASRPVLIIARTQIGKGSPNLEGTSDIHGKVMGQAEVEATKAAHNIPIEPLFYIDDAVQQFFEAQQASKTEMVQDWTREFDLWATTNTKLARQWMTDTSTVDPQAFHMIKTAEIKPNIATRASSGALIQTIAAEVPQILGGSADLSCSDSTFIKTSNIVSKSDFSGQNIKYGVREFGMAAVANGIALHNQNIPFVGTFMTFSDYCKNAVRLAALMNLRVIYQFTHDSIFLGEDGPTHQPVEHLAALRAIPNLTVIRPADTTEVKAAWITALKNTGPTALILSRQGAPDLDTTSIDDAQKGAYILHKSDSDTIDFCILATGTEVALAKDVCDTLEAQGKTVRLVSVPSFELFNAQDNPYQDKVLGGNVTQYVSIEAQSSFGWHQYIGRDGIAISVDTFGISAPAKDIAKAYGFTTDAIVEKLLA